MTDIPKISIFSSAHRPENWKQFYKSIGDNDTSFEIIYVGPNEPNFKLPKNFRFIKSLVKPSQCFEIAARNAKADLILNVNDDIVFMTERPIDKLYDTYKSCNDDKIIVSCKCTQNNNFFGVIVPIMGLMSKDLYRRIGGIDRNFMVCYWDTDIALRVHVLGGRTVMSDVLFKEICEIENWKKYGDRQFLDSLWLTDKKIHHFNRTRPVEPFSDYRILEESQGKKEKKWV